MEGEGTRQHPFARALLAASEAVFSDDRTMDRVEIRRAGEREFTYRVYFLGDKDYEGGIISQADSD